MEGQNVLIEYRSSEGQLDRLPALVAEFIRRPVDVIAGNTVAMLAAKKATTTIPIVFAGGSDPIKQGLVTSLNRPGGNVTGAMFFAGELGTKRLELLRLLVPKATSIGMLVNPNTDETEAERRDILAAGRAMGQQLIILDVASLRDIETAFTTLVQHSAGAVLIGAGPFLDLHRERLVALTARYALPAIHHQREFVVAGGLMSYGTSITDANRQAGIYAGRILKGEKPADLPVIQSTKFEFVLNLRTAKALGIEVADRALALADEVIE